MMSAIMVESTGETQDKHDLVQFRDNDARVTYVVGTGCRSQSGFSAGEYMCWALCSAWGEWGMGSVLWSKRCEFDIPGQLHLRVPLRTIPRQV